MSKLLTLLSPLGAAKFWVAVVMGLLSFLQVYTGTDFGLDQEIVTGLIGGIGALFVWLVPNRKPKVPVYTDEEALAVNNAQTGKQQTTVYRK